MLFDSIDLLALFGVYAGIIFTINIRQRYLRADHAGRFSGYIIKVPVSSHVGPPYFTRHVIYVIIPVVTITGKGTN